ncbi:FBX7 protein, partial [Polypterus senegalus]|nr:FBX7 protein [Polypterus senegalus]
MCRFVASFHNVMFLKLNRKRKIAETKQMKDVTQRLTKAIERTLHQSRVQMDGEYTGDISTEMELAPDMADQEGEAGLFSPGPMLCSEAEDGQIPHSLETLYYASGCSNPCDAVVVVIHLLMLEMGYEPQFSNLPAQKTTQMPNGWKAGEIYKFEYLHALCEGSSTLLIAVPMGRFIVVNDTSTRPRDTDWKDMATKATPDIPNFIFHAHQCKHWDASCFDIMDNCNSALSAADVEMSEQSDSESDAEMSPSVNLYKMKYKQKKDKAQFCRFRVFPRPRPQPFPFQPSPFYPFPFSPNLPYPPGILGGEYDERPQLPYSGPGFPFLPGANSDIRQPFRPAFDPFGPQHGNPRGNFTRRHPARSSDIRRGFI